MKLHNKKTGEIINSKEILTDEFIINLFSKDFNHFISELDKIQEEWEGVKDPLIKDEKIRRTVKAWSDINGINEVSYIILSDGLSVFCTDEIEINFTFQVEGVHDDKRYTIAELCGEK